MGRGRRRMGGEGEKEEWRGVSNGLPIGFLAGHSQMSHNVGNGEGRAAGDPR